MKVTLFANMKQKWDMLIGNLAEYKKLRQDCTRLWQEVEEKRGRLTGVYNYVGSHKKGEYCINISFVQTPERVIEGQQYPIMLVQLCDKFKADGDAVCPCQNTSCPHNAANKNFADAMADYSVAVARRRAFWGASCKTKQ